MMDNIEVPAHEDNKCAHSACNCPVHGSEPYCSELCKVGDSLGDVCECGHPECLGPLR